MAFLRKIIHSSTTISYTSLLPPSLLVLHRQLSIKLFVGGLSFQTNEEALSEAFSKYGQVIESKVVTNRVSQKSKGFGFVTFASDEEAHTAVEEMNGKSLHGRVIFVDYAKPETSFRADIPLARGPLEPISSPET